MTSEMTLEPCPFCGGNAVAENYIVEAQVVCLGCRAKIVRSHGAHTDNGVQETFAAWNTRTHLTKPAQAVDVGAIREVIESHRCVARLAGENDLRLRDTSNAWADKLARALSGEKAGPVGDGWQPIETAPKDKRILCVWLGAPGCEEVDVAVNCTETTRGQVVGWCSPHDCDDRYCAPDYWMPIKPLPASPAPDKE